METAGNLWTVSQWGNIPPPVGGHSGTIVTLKEVSEVDTNNNNDNSATSTTTVTTPMPYLVMFGGNADLSEPRRPATMGSSMRGEKNTLLDSTYALNLESLQWTEVQPKGTGPTPRYAHSATVWMNDKVIIFGGVDVTQSQLNDVHVLDFESTKKCTWQATTTEGKLPAPRYGHTLTNVNEDLILFGGTQGGSDLWKLSIDENFQCTWKELTVKGTPPSSRAYHGAVSTFTGKHHYLVLFGGRQVSEKGSKALNDMHVIDFDFKNNSINWVHPKVSGTVPTPRYSHSMCVINMMLYVFGGMCMNSSNQYESTNELFVFDIIKQVWIRSHNIVSPLPRSRHICGASNDRIYVFGGNDGPNWLSDLSVLNLRTDNKQPLVRTRSEESVFFVSTVSTVDSQYGVKESSPAALVQSARSSLAQIKGLSESSRNLNPNAIGNELLNLLKNHFHPIPEYRYEVGQPSHRWSSEEMKTKFATLLEETTNVVLPLFKKDPPAVRMKSPAYVLGDIHGNYKDLVFFGTSFWRFGIKLCPANILFLGDYVDRGPHSLETLGYLFAMKALAPQKVFMLRGNHETRDVNGNTAMFRDGSFRSQCYEHLGRTDGENLWQRINDAFDFLPLAACIDRKIFCVHGGIPRFKTQQSYIEELNSVSRPITDDTLDNDSNRTQPFLFDLLWSDPATEDEDEEMLERSIEFAKNVPRGGNTAIFGSMALENFFKNTRCTHLIRAHQPPNQGVQIEKSARVLTVFSSSHYCGNYNKAACVLVADSRIRIIVIKPELNQETQSDDEIEERTTFYNDPE